MVVLEPEAEGKAHKAKSTVCKDCTLRSFGNPIGYPQDNGAGDLRIRDDNDNSTGSVAEDRGQRCGTVSD
jgi:hypothetical protein